MSLYSPQSVASINQYFYINNGWKDWIIWKGSLVVMNAESTITTICSLASFSKLFCHYSPQLNCCVDLVDLLSLLSSASLAAAAAAGGCCILPAQHHKSRQITVEFMSGRYNRQELVRPKTDRKGERTLDRDSPSGNKQDSKWMKDLPHVCWMCKEAKVCYQHVHHTIRLILGLQMTSFIID